MGKKQKVEIGGKVYWLEAVDEKAAKDEEEEEDKPTEKDEEEEDDEEKADALAEEIVAKLGLGDIKKSIEELKEKAKDTSAESKVAKILNLESLKEKDVNKMTTEEKIIGFFGAMLHNDHTTLKALSEGTAADGGYLFPDEFRAEIIRDIADTPHMRGEVTVIPMKRDIMNIPTLVSKPQVTWTEENSTKSTTTAHFGQATLTVKKMAAIMYLSDELIEDSTEIDVVQFIIGLFSEALGDEEDRVITRGNGTTEPTGYQGAFAYVNATVGNLTFDDVIDLEYGLPSKYQKNAKFYAHRNLIRDMRKIKDSNNRYLWIDSVAVGQPATFHGKIVIEDNNLPEQELYFADLKQAYWLGDRKKMTVKVTQDTETAFTKDQTAIRVVSRIAGYPVLAAAGRALGAIA